MSRTYRLALFLLTILMLAANSAYSQGQPPQSAGEMVTEGEINLTFRYRYEYVDQDNFDRNARASTLKSRITFKSAQYMGLSFLAEVDNVSYIGDDDFNSTDNGNTNYPTVADPKGTEFNQAWIKYSWNDLSGLYGRQRIHHGNQRFVGGVGWRQNEQTFDGFRAMLQNDSGLTVDYSYVYNVNRLFGPDDTDAQPGNLPGDNHLLRLDYKFAEGHTLSGFAYLLDVKERRSYAPGLSVDNSSDTFGLEYKGQFGPVGLKAAYASQSDAADSNLDYDADYYVLEGTAAFDPITFKLGYEVLAGDSGVGFKTPYATLHAFQGWADKFLTTPTDGIEDFYVGVSGKLGPVSLGATYHDFQAEDSSADFGSEIDLVASWPFNDIFSFQFHYADFSGDTPERYDDTRKAWFTVNVKL